VHGPVNFIDDTRTDLTKIHDNHNSTNNSRSSSLGNGKMKTLFKAAMIMLVVIWLVPGAQAQNRGTVYVVCRKFVAERNCYKCSDYCNRSAGGDQ
jgi:hypothetical protein